SQVFEVAFCHEGHEKCFSVNMFFAGSCMDCPFTKQRVHYTFWQSAGTFDLIIVIEQLSSIFTADDDDLFSTECPCFKNILTAKAFSLICDIEIPLFHNLQSIIETFVSLNCAHMFSSIFSIHIIIYNQLTYCQLLLIWNLLFDFSLSVYHIFV